MRIDVNHDPVGLEGELDALHARLRQAGGGLSSLPAVGTHVPGLVTRWREADGEYYAYVEETRTGTLVGCTVFNRLIEVDRRLDPHVRSPHSRYRGAWQRLGLASAVYRRALDAGVCLVSGARQSEGASALWDGLARDHGCGWIELRDRSAHWLGPDVDARRRENLQVRRVLFGRGWDARRLQEAARGAPAGGARAARTRPAAVRVPQAARAPAGGPPAR